MFLNSFLFLHSCSFYLLTSTLPQQPALSIAKKGLIAPEEEKQKPVTLKPTSKPEAEKPAEKKIGLKKVAKKVA